MVGRTLSMELVINANDNKLLKEEVNKYIHLLYSQRDLPKKNELIAITKLIILSKTVVNHLQPNHYRNSFIFDILSVMHSLTGNSIRQFNFMLRSLIENYHRSMLNLEDADQTGVNELFKRSEEKFQTGPKEKAILDFIYGEYGKCCMVVHSNIKARTNIQLFYADIIKNDDFTKKNLTSTIDRVYNILKSMVELFISTKPLILENAFYRRKQQLRYLLNFNMYKQFSENVKKLT